MAPIKHRGRRRRSRTRRLRSEETDTSDEDFELDEDDGSSEEVEQEEEDEQPVEEHDSEEEEDRTVNRSRKRARQASSTRGLRNSKKRSRGSGEKHDGESSSQGAERGRQEGRIQRGTRRSGTESEALAKEILVVEDSDEEGTDKGREKSKGKQKIDEADDTEEKRQVTEEESAAVCGICLSEEVVERGKLDCCDHFFCYECIMEWAKVESRCPMCKQRFAAIVRPANAGSRRNRTIRIPLRNQVYIPPEDEVVAVVDDPYADIACMECQEVGEEGLLLLCDRCDSAAHTYCVGLGRSVPRGDWFCRSCQTHMPESSGGEDDIEDFVLGFSDDDESDIIRAIVASTEARIQRAARRTSVQRALSSATRVLPSATRTRRARSNVRRRLWRRLSSRRRSRVASVPRLSQSFRALVREAESTSNQGTNTSDRQSGPARTVPLQRRLQERIQILRENWEGIQSGTQQFPSSGHNTAASAGAVPDSNEWVISSSSQPLSRSVRKLVSTDENDSRGLSNPLMNSIDPVTAREGSRDKDSGVAQAWLMMENARNLHVGGSTMNGQQRLAGPQQNPSVPGSRQEDSGARQHAEPPMKAIVVFNGRPGNGSISLMEGAGTTTKAAEVPDSRAGKGSNLSIDSAVLNHGHGIAPKQNDFRGKFLGEVAESSSREQYPNKINMQECTAGPSSTAPHDITADLGECSKQRVPCFSHSEAKAMSVRNIRESVSPHVKGSSVGSGSLTNASETVSHSSNPLNVQDMRCKTSGSTGLILQSGYSSILNPSNEVPKVGSEHKYLGTSGKQQADSLEKNYEGQLSCETKQLAYSATSQDFKSGKLHASVNDYGSVERCDQDASILPSKTLDLGVGNMANEHGFVVPTASRNKNGRIILCTTNNEQEHVAHVANERSSSLANTSHLRKKGKAEGLKDKLINMVKAELWPLYLSKGLGKEQFKEIARSATHTLLDLSGMEDRKTSTQQFTSLSCSHSELQSQSLIAGCCDSCFKLQVRNVVRVATDKSSGQ